MINIYGVYFVCCKGNYKEIIEEQLASIKKSGLLDKTTELLCFICEFDIEVMKLFITDFDENDLQGIVNRSYSTFTHPDVTLVVKQGDVHILELFHGPTYAFKDVALQFLGNIFEYLLNETGSKMNILGATSGDTGSAAIYGVRGKKGINIFIIHPHKRVSQVQELQMTTVTDNNVFNIAIKGTFDDGQAIVKSIFNDIPYKEKGGVMGLASDNQSIYTISRDKSKVYRIDKEGELDDEIKFKTNMDLGNAITCTGEYFWTAGGCEKGLCKWKKDGTLVGEIYPVAEGTWALAWDGTYLWTIQRANELLDDPKIYQIEIINANLTS